MFENQDIDQLNNKNFKRLATMLHMLLTDSPIQKTNITSEFEYWEEGPGKNRVKSAIEYPTGSVSGSVGKITYYEYDTKGRICKETCEDYILP